LPTLPPDDFGRIINKEWPKAVRHSQIPHERLSLWRGEETPPELRSVAAHYFAPHLPPDPPYAFSAEQYEEATSPEMAGKHRIVMHLDYDYPEDLAPAAAQALIGALLRHELEHAKQVEHWGPDLFNIHDQFLYRAMGHYFGGSTPGIYVNAMPIELDANAAASEYLCEHHPEHIESLLDSDCANLARAQVPPQPLGTLMTRTIAFLYVFRRSIEATMGETSVMSQLKPYSSEAAEVWRRLAEPEDTDRPER
jgi:hypothetical protein